MQNKLKIWKPGSTWEQSEFEWDRGNEQFHQSHPLKTLTSLPRMPGITKETAKGLKFKSIKYLLSHDKNNAFPRFFFKHPIKYALRWIQSAFNKHAYRRDQDFFFYGLKDVEEFLNLAQKKNSLLVIGFSYCHKPFECPAGRFSDACIHDPEHPICRQCFIGKAVNALPLEKASIQPLFIPTVHYIGEKMFELTDAHPDKQILFLITACEMTLEMFGDWGNMVGARGIGVRLDGRICNTMKAFELSEQGIKPGLTIVLPETQARMLALIKSLWNSLHNGASGEKA